MYTTHTHTQVVFKLLLLLLLLKSYNWHALGAFYQATQVDTSIILLFTEIEKKQNDICVDLRRLMESFQCMSIIVFYYGSKYPNAVVIAFIINTITYIIIYK